jgi:hypothetical protein
VRGGSRPFAPAVAPLPLPYAPTACELPPHVGRGAPPVRASSYHHTRGGTALPAHTTTQPPELNQPMPGSPLMAESGCDVLDLGKQMRQQGARLAVGELLLEYKNDLEVGWPVCVSCVRSRILTHTHARAIRVRGPLCSLAHDRQLGVEGNAQIPRLVWFRRGPPPVLTHTHTRTQTHVRTHRR